MLYPSPSDPEYLLKQCYGEDLAPDKEWDPVKANSWQQTHKQNQTNKQTKAHKQTNGRGPCRRARTRTHTQAHARAHKGVHAHSPTTTPIAATQYNATHAGRLGGRAEAGVLEYSRGRLGGRAEAGDSEYYHLGRLGGRAEAAACRSGTER